MLTEASEIFQKFCTKAGWQLGLITPNNCTKPRSSEFAFQYYISKNTINDSSLNLDGIYFTGSMPVIYIKTLSSYDPYEIFRLHRRFWNECRTPLTLIITPTLINVLNNYARPVNDPSEISQIELHRCSTADKDLNELADILKQSKLDNEKVLGPVFNLSTHNRVDKKLISQLREARRQLHEKFNLTLSTIHDLLGRSLFTLYLEQREILTKNDIFDVTKVSDNFFDLLRSYPKETYILFSFLQEKINGNLFPITKIEEEKVIANPDILILVYECFTGETDLKNGQKSLFNIFDFKYIPIELISAIYEEFMSEEDLKKNIIIKNQTNSKKELGAYYTPQMLVEFVYNEVLPMPSNYDCNFNLKILDPACGSGIFLVEGFKRIIERWKYSNNQATIPKEILSELLYNGIFGIELHPEAIKITAFSLYLTFLNYMNPKEVLRNLKFSPLIIWTDLNLRKNVHSPKLGSNLLQANTFIRLKEEDKKNPNSAIKKFFKNRFDFVIGNPPWRRGNVDKEVLAWAKHHGCEIEKDIIKGYLSYIPFIAPYATIALISSAKVLFNTCGTDESFRIKFFIENKVSLIVNFAVIRSVLFERSKHAATLIVYSKRNDNIIKDTEVIIYCIPKTYKAIQCRNTITINSSEIKYLPIQEVVKINSRIFKITMYGNLRDLKFINKLNRIASIEKSNVIEGAGLNKDKDATHKGNPHLEDHFFIITDDIKPYYTPRPSLRLGEFQFKSLYRTDKRDIFSPPLVLFKEGTKDGLLCCSYIDYYCVFLSESKSIKFLNKSDQFHKAMVACLNSSLALYYFIQTSSSIGVDRNRIQKNEVSLFPAIPYKLSDDSINLLSEKVDNIINVYTNVSDLLFDPKQRISSIKKEIDDIIYTELFISKAEKALIENVLNYSNVIKKNYSESRAENAVSFQDDVKQYVTTFIEVINNLFTSSLFRLSATIYTNRNDELVCVEFLFNKDRKTKNEISESSEDISKLLHTINSYIFELHSKSIYYRKIIKYDFRDGFYLIKPNEKRFWSKASALFDADNLIVEILNQRIN